MGTMFYEAGPEISVIPGSAPDLGEILGVPMTSGPIRWSEDQVIRFPGGIPGFENAQRFIILAVPDYEPFHWMECVDGGQTVRFAIVNPLAFRPDYQPKIRKADLDTLNIRDPKDLLLYVIVTLKQPLERSTANLMGPLFINIRDRIGRQLLIENEAYSLQEPILG